MDIQKEINDARKAQDKTRLSVLQGLKSAIDNAKLRKGSINSELNDLEVIGVIRAQVKQRQESAESFSKAGRLELMLKETAEKEVLEGYLPKQLTAFELELIVDRAIAEVGATSKKELGKVIKLAVTTADGRASNQEISALAGSKLA